MSRRRLTPAIAYLRTSSAGNVGLNKDGDKCQRNSIQGLARRAGYKLVAEFCDAAVNGADPIGMRAGFAAILECIERGDAKAAIVEAANRFARDLIVQGVGYTKLGERGIQLVTANGSRASVRDVRPASSGLWTSQRLLRRFSRQLLWRSAYTVPTPRPASVCM